MVVSTRNNGAVADLPYDCAAEVSSIITAAGPRPVNFGKLPTAARGIVQAMKAMEELTIEAAVTGNYGTALQAFIANPLVPSGKIARTVLNELLVAHKKHLPQFADTIAKIESGELK
jgi:6-phospho-beta-glucosidase